MTDERKYSDEPDYEEIDILSLIKSLLTNWKKLLVWMCGGIAFGIMITVCTPKTYVATAKMAPEVATRSSGGSLNSLASMAGINLGGVSTSDAMQPDLYPEIVKSTPFIVDLFSVPVKFKVKGTAVETDVYDYFCNYFKEPWWTKLAKFPMKIRSWVKSITKGKPDPVHGYENVNVSRLTSEQSRVQKRLRDSIVIAVDKKTNIISTTATTQNPSVSTVLVAEVVSRIQSYVTKYRTDKARHDLEYYQQLYDDAQTAYYEAQQKYARFVDANQGIVLQRVRIEEQRLQNEANLAFQVYNGCAQQVQVAKAKVQQDTPVTTVIQPPVYPLKNNAPSGKTIIFIFAFLAVVIESFWLLLGRKWVEDYKARKID